MNVLLVGGTGFIGTELARELVDRGHDVAVLSRDPSDATLSDSVERIAGDTTDYDDIEGAFADRDAVVFLVALEPLFKPRGGEERHFEVHLGGTENAVRAAEAHGVGRFVQLSALGADPAGPTAYIRAKGEAEDVVRSSGLAWTIVRPSIVFGEGAGILRFSKLLAPPYIAGLPGGGDIPFQPIWRGDFVPILADIVEGRSATAEPDPEDSPHAGATYEFGGPEVLTLAEIVTLAHAADGRPVWIVPIPMPLAKLGLTVLDVIPLVPLGRDQYRALQLDNRVEDNDVDVFGYDEAELTTLAAFLGVDPAVAA